MKINKQKKLKKSKTDHKLKQEHVTIHTGV